VKPIKAVLDFIGVLPGYTEIDISAIFLLFLSLFFAMLVGDAGYGLIFLALTAWGRRKFSQAPAYPFHLMYIMSFGTVMWGAVTGTWFGAGHLPGFLEGLTVAWLREPKNVMLMCFVIGAVHLTLAHLWIISRTWNSLKALAQLGWIGSTWTMFFMARNLVLGQPLPAWIGGVFVASVVLIILFMTAPRDFKNEWFNHVMLPLNLVSNFVDVVSYIRLFAVGTAGYAVASSFNKMILGGGPEGLVAGLIAALLLFLGHTLNILLSVMGVLVHGVRLNTLEFSSHIGMAWTGVPYRPFQRIGKTEH
jgi:V/A-type H+-transporting ATPase subunit I